MADSTLAALSAIVTGNIAGTELLYTDDGASDLKMTTAQVRDWLKTQFTDNLEFVCDGGGSALTAKNYGYIEVPYSCTIKTATLLGDASGSVVVDIYKCTYANFAPGTHPVSGDKITASAPPTISSAFKSQDSTLTGWTTTLTAGDILAFTITGSPATITRVTASLKVQRS
jgi:hypothetical protein